MDKTQLKNAFKEYAEVQEFKLNPDEKHVDFILEGILKNEKDKGLKYCPCRLTSGDFDRDVELICPCNFQIQDTYKKQNRCWCGLFVKR